MTVRLGARIVTFTLSLLRLLVASGKTEVGVEGAVCQGEGGLGGGQTSPHRALTRRLGAPGLGLRVLDRGRGRDLPSE